MFYWLVFLLNIIDDNQLLVALKAMYRKKYTSRYVGLVKRRELI
jgi:hypothetical protein